MALAEFVQISQQVEHDKEMRAGYVDIFTKPSWRKRAILTLFLMYVKLQSWTNLPCGTDKVIRFASQSTGVWHSTRPADIQEY